MKDSLLTRLKGSAVVASCLPGQRIVPFLPHRQIRQIRDLRIRRLVRYAAQNVPYYRRWFASTRIDPREIRGAPELEQLPLLDRAQLRAQPEDFVAEPQRTKGALSFLTSGTTGEPMRVFHDRRSLWGNIAFGEREREAFIKICGGGFRPKELYVGYETSTFKAVISFYSKTVLFPVRPRRRFLPLHTPIEEVVDVMNAERPDILVGYGGWIDLFFRTAAARGLRPHTPKMVMYMGEALPQGARDYIEGELGIPILTRYNAVEAFKIGFYCEARTGFHIHEDLCHVRIVGPDGTTLPAGEHGEIVISNLINRATVLLNYPMGDVAALCTDESCPCGRKFARLSELEGRTEDVLKLSDGRRIHPRAIWEVLKAERGIVHYQLVQQARTRFVLRLVAAPDCDRAQLQRRVVEGLQTLLGPDAELNTTLLTEPARAPGQKFRAVACEIPSLKTGAEP